MKKIAVIVACCCLLPLVALAAWRTKISKSNGTTVVTIVEAPAASKSRTVPANGGVTVCNTASSNIAFAIYFNEGATTNVLETNVVLSAGATYINDWVTILDATTNTIEFVGNGAFGAAAHITTRYRDENQ